MLNKLAQMKGKSGTQRQIEENILKVLQPSKKMVGNDVTNKENNSNNKASKVKLLVKFRKSSNHGKINDEDCC